MKLYILDTIQNTTYNSCIQISRDTSWQTSRYTLMYISNYKLLFTLLNTPMYTFKYTSIYTWCSVSVYLFLYSQAYWIEQDYTLLVQCLIQVEVNSCIYFELLLSAYSLSGRLYGSNFFHTWKCACLYFFKNAFLCWIHQQNANRFRSHMQTSHRLWAISAVLVSTARCFPAHLELSNVLTDSARAFPGASESTCSYGGTFWMLQDLTYSIFKCWSCWDLCTGLQNTSTAAEISAQICGRLREQLKSLRRSEGNWVQ